MNEEGKEQLDDATDVLESVENEKHYSNSEEGDSFEKNESETERDEIHSNVVRAGKRTYFFDVKATRNEDYYLTITESKKRFNKNGRYYFEKHKIFLYKEDFDKFSTALKESIEFIKKEKPEIAHEIESHNKKSEDFTDVEFEDLDNNS